MRKLTKAAVLGAAVAVTGIALLPTAANAEEVISTPTIQAGATGELAWGFSMPTNVGTMTDGQPLVFNAPDHTTFPDQTTVRAASSLGATNFRLDNCTVGSAGKTLACATKAGSGNAWVWPQFSTATFYPTVSVDADAPSGTFIGAPSTLSMVGSAGSQNATASLRVQIEGAATPAPSAPPVDSIDNSSGSTVISGRGEPGATIQITNATGSVLGTADVAADGTWSVNMGTDMSQNPEDLEVTQSLGGQTSPATAIAAATLPIINPAVAGGAGLAALLGAGAFLLRRRMA